MSYILDIDFSRDLMEGEAKSVLETVGYDVTFRTVSNGRQMTAVFRDIGWTFALYKGRYDRNEIKAAIDDIPRAKKSNPKA